MNEAHFPGRQPRSHRPFAAIAAATWLVTTLGIGAFCVLKSGTSAGDLPLLPPSLARWLDYHGDLRTLVMTLAVTLPPALLLARPRTRPQRWQYIGGAVALLMAFECLQLLIPSRGFGFWDLTYTAVGGVLTESCALLLERRGRSRPAIASGEH